MKVECAAFRRAYKAGLFMIGTTLISRMEDEKYHSGTWQLAMVIICELGWTWRTRSNEYLGNPLRYFFAEKWRAYWAILDLVFQTTLIVNYCSITRILPNSTN